MTSIVDLLTDRGWHRSVPLPLLIQANQLMDKLREEGNETQGPELTELGWVVRYRPVEPLIVIWLYKIPRGPAGEHRRMEPMREQVVAKLTSELNASKNPNTKKLAGMLMAYLDNNSQHADKFLAKDKTIEGAFKAMAAEAMKVQFEGVAVLGDDEGFAIVLKYYGIENVSGSSSEQVAPALTLVTGGATKKPAKFTANLSDLL